MRQFWRWVRAHFMAKVIGIAFGFLLMPAILALIFTCVINYRSLSVQLDSLNSQLISTASSQMRNVLCTLYDIPNEIYVENNAEIMRILRKKDGFAAHERTTIQSLLSRLMKKDDNLLGIIITGNNGDSFHEYRFLSESRWQSYVQQTELEEGFNCIRVEEKPYIGAYQVTLIDFPSYDVLAKVQLYYSYDKWDEIALHLCGREKGCAIWLIDDAGRIIYDYGALSGLDGSQISGGSEAAAGNYRGNKGWYYEKEVAVGGSSFRLIKFVPKSNITDVITRSIIPIIAIDTVLLVCMVVFLLITYRSILKPVRRIADNTEKVGRGIYEYQSVNHSVDEIGRMERQYEQMVKNIDYLVNEEMKHEIELAQSRLKTLQAQINPHFLNNILQLIGTQALCEGSVQTNKLICSLGRMLRYNMDVDQESVTLQDELANLRHYMILQKEQYGERIDCQMEIDEECKSLIMPKMILQPLVENAIKYSGVRNKGNCMVIIRIYRTDKEIHFSIQDNGPGFSEEKKLEIKALYDQNRMQVIHGHGVGLLNVLFRMRIFYKDAFGWEIENKDDGCQILLYCEEIR